MGSLTFPVSTGDNDEPSKGSLIIRISDSLLEVATWKTGEMAASVYRDD